LTISVLAETRQVQTKNTTQRMDPVMNMVEGQAE
jgi:hypothetical protein